MKILTRQILRVEMKLFCRPTENQREFMKKIRQGVSFELITMKPNFSSFHIPDNDFGYFFFSQTTSYVEETFSRIRQTGKCLLSRRNGKLQQANVENGGKIMVTWSLFPFAFYVI